MKTMGQEIKKSEQDEFMPWVELAKLKESIMESRISK
jgi:hypothetical protein